MHYLLLSSKHVLLIVFIGCFSVAQATPNSDSEYFLDTDWEPIESVDEFDRKKDEKKEEDLEDDEHSEKNEETIEERITRIRDELAAAEATLAEQAKVTETEVEPEMEIPMGALVVISSNQSGGSGFIGEMRNKTFLITNIHVLGLAGDASIQTLDGTNLELPAYAYLSAERDVAIVPLQWEGEVLPVSDSLGEDNLKMGTRITVMGNSDGARVATRLKGTIEGIGPDELQVSAKFVPGNSGSPVVHDTSGKVVAIASYMRDLSAKTKWTEDTELADIRRFGYRLDGEVKWERVQLADLYEQAEAFNHFKDRTEVISHIAYMMEFERMIMTSYRSHQSLGHLLEDFDGDFQWQRGTASAHNIQLLKRFTNGLLSALRSDRGSTEKLLKIGFYKCRFKEVENSRDRIAANLSRFQNSL